MGLPDTCAAQKNVISRVPLPDASTGICINVDMNSIEPDLEPDLDLEPTDLLLQPDVVSSPPPADAHGLPWRLVIPLCLLQVVESFNSSGIYSYLPALVLEFEPTLDRDSVGRWAGFIASSVYLGAFLSSYAWGRLSDRIGKRITLLLGTTATLLCCLAMGIATNVWAAMAIRFMSGLCNGNLGVVKARACVGGRMCCAHALVARRRTWAW